MSGRDAAGGGLITWANLFAAKKWRFSSFRGARSASPGSITTTGANHNTAAGWVEILRCTHPTRWTYPAENGPDRFMADRIFPLNRRELMAGLGAAALGPAIPPMAVAQGRPSMTLHAKADV